MTDRYQRSGRPSQDRRPLGPGDMRANMNPAPHSAGKALKAAASSPADLPNVTAVTQEHPSRVRNSPAESQSNKRVAAIVNDSQRRNTKRDSEISNASSTASGRKRVIGRWQLGKTIGRGGCSTVRLVRHVETGQEAAVKIISRKMAEQVRAQSLANLAATPDKSLQDLVAAGKAAPPIPPGLLREIAIMKLLDHSNIVKLYDVWENHNELYLIMEYVKGGELFHYVEECRGLEERESVYIFRQIVAALLYCHRLHIHHRDLKPENILLNRETAQVKLVDFGMAAFQPEGKQLTTACGSPHYAAPEVIKSRPYDGAKADAWSCGVILYVMLTGTTPFNYDQERNLGVMYQAIAVADYYMPPELSYEAKDLLRRIFVPRPEKRISMDEIWDHPFMHKFDKEWGYQGAMGAKEAWIGPVPMLDEWTVTREEDIDKDILRNMRPLWHSVPQNILVRKLLSREPNQEKYFYAALLKHKEEHMENYMGGNDGVSYAGSDYQHARMDPNDAQSGTREKQHSQSSYSIMGNEHLRTSSVAPEDAPPLPTDVPRHPVPNKPASHRKSVTLKTATAGSAKTHVRSHSRQPTALRVEALKKASRQSVVAGLSGQRPQSPTPGPSEGRSTSRSSVQKRASRQSLVSSVWGSSPPVAVPVRSAGAHKRNVSFQHCRKNSNASGLSMTASVSAVQFTPELKAKAQQTQQEKAADTAAYQTSPTPGAGHHRKKSRNPSYTPRSKNRNSEAMPTHYKSQVRNASTELEKACEEAFFRSSYDSTDRTGITEKGGPYDTPPSSVSPHNAEFEESDGFRRPLPALPTDTPNTFIARTLEETRKKLAARSAENDGDHAKFEEILATLERIMPLDADRRDLGSNADLERRVGSAPEPKSATDVRFLPIITEEPHPDTLRGGRNSANHNYGHRSFTAPGPVRGNMPYQHDETIRALEPPTAPRSDDEAEEVPRPKTADSATNNRHLQVPNPYETMLRKSSHDSAVGLRSSPPHDQETFTTDTTVARKKSSWFRRWKDTTVPTETRAISQTTTTEWKELDDRQYKPKPNVLKRDKAPPALKLDSRAIDQAAPSTDSGEYPIRKTPEATENKFSKWFGMKKKDEPLKSADSKDLPTMTSFLATTPPTEFPMTPVTPITPSEPTRSWFSRFLRLRPESRVLCFDVPRGRARTETYRLLRDWQPHGISDLVYYPQDNAITARVDKNNALGIKPVSFRIELFVVLQNGKKVGLSLGRWTQTRGAASSFRRVLSVVEEVLSKRGVLVEEEEKCRELEGILG